MRSTKMEMSIWVFLRKARLTGRAITLGGIQGRSTTGSGITDIDMATASGKTKRAIAIWASGSWAEQLATVCSLGSEVTSTRGNGVRT
jgi:hypothetical protein